MLNKEEIINHLKDGGTVRVNNLWNFNQLHMDCDFNEMYPCCEEYYSDYDEAFTAIIDFSDSQEENVRLT